MSLICGLCTLCNTWHYFKELVLGWEESPGVLRGICDGCQERLEKEASELDWGEDDK